MLIASDNIMKSCPMEAQLSASDNYGDCRRSTSVDVEHQSLPVAPPMQSPDSDHDISRRLALKKKIETIASRLACGRSTENVPLKDVQQLMMRAATSTRSLSAHESSSGLSSMDTSSEASGDDTRICERRSSFGGISNGQDSGMGDLSSNVNDSSIQSGSGAAANIETASTIGRVREAKAKFEGKLNDNGEARLRGRPRSPKKRPIRHLFDRLLSMSKLKSTTYNSNNEIARSSQPDITKSNSIWYQHHRSGDARNAFSVAPPRYGSPHLPSNRTVPHQAKNLKRNSESDALTYAIRQAGITSRHPTNTHSG